MKFAATNFGIPKIARGSAILTLLTKKSILDNDWPNGIYN